MKQLKNSLVLFAGLLAFTGVVTLFIPSLTQGKSSDVPKSAFSVSRRATGPNAIVSGPTARIVKKIFPTDAIVAEDIRTFARPTIRERLLYECKHARG